MNTKNEKAKEQFEQETENMDQDKVREAFNDAYAKIEDMGGNIPKSLEKLWDNITTMVDLLGDWASGEYRAPWNTIAAVAAALIYFVCPIDLIPDFIPVFGYMDDAAVITYALSLMAEDIEEYRQWRSNRHMALAVGQ